MMDVLFAMTPHTAAHTINTVVACACLLLCLMFPLTRAADLAELQVSESEGVYRINLVMQVQAPAQHVHHVLTDYARIYRLDPAIIDSEILPSPDGGVVRVRTRIVDCIAFFCTTIDRVEDVRERDGGGLQATTVPTLSSFKSGHAEWKVLGMEEHTQLVYQAQMEPDFFIPPLIGSYFVKRKLRQSMLASLLRIECLARIQAGLERNSGPEDTALMADEETDDHTVGVALLAGQDPTLIARALAAGSTAGEHTGCAQPCSSNNASCQP